MIDFQDVVVVLAKHSKDVVYVVLLGSFIGIDVYLRRRLRRIFKETLQDVKDSRDSIRDHARELQQNNKALIDDYRSLQMTTSTKIEELNELSKINAKLRFNPNITFRDSSGMVAKEVLTITEVNDKGFATKVTHTMADTVREPKGTIASNRRKGASHIKGFDFDDDDDDEVEVSSVIELGGVLTEVFSNVAVDIISDNLSKSEEEGFYPNHPPRHTYERALLGRPEDVIQGVQFPEEEVITMRTVEDEPQREEPSQVDDVETSSSSYESSSDSGSDSSSDDGGGSDD